MKDLPHDKTVAINILNAMDLSSLPGKYDFFVIDEFDGGPSGKENVHIPVIGVTRYETGLWGLSGIGTADFASEYGYTRNDIRLFADHLSSLFRVEKHQDRKLFVWSSETDQDRPKSDTFNLSLEARPRKKWRMPCGRPCSMTKFAMTRRIGSHVAGK